MSGPAVAYRNITKRYGAKTAVNGVSLEIPAGSSLFGSRNASAAAGAFAAGALGWLAYRLSLTVAGGLLKSRAEKLLEVLDKAPV